MGYAVSVRGACHVSNMTYLLEWWAIRYPEIGLDKHYKDMSAEYRGEAVAKTSALGCIMNSSCWCEFPGVIFTMNQWVELFNAVADYQYTLESLMDTGTRIWLLQRCLGNIWGATGADDRLGKRIMTPTKDGSIAGVVPDMETMLREFYEYQGLREDGLPTQDTLEKLGLGYLAEKIGL